MRAYASGTRDRSACRRSRVRVISRALSCHRCAWPGTAARRVAGTRDRFATRSGRAENREKDVRQVDRPALKELEGGPMRGSPVSCHAGRRDALECHKRSSQPSRHGNPAVLPPSRRKIRGFPTPPHGGCGLTERAPVPRIPALTLLISSDFARRWRRSTGPQSLPIGRSRALELFAPRATGSSVMQADPPLAPHPPPSPE
jgi:hypothetical protein